MITPIFIPISTGGSTKLSGVGGVIYAVVALAGIYFVLYMLILVVTNKNEYKELSLVGKILFFPIGAIWIFD